MRVFRIFMALFLFATMSGHASASLFQFFYQNELAGELTITPNSGANLYKSIPNGYVATQFSYKNFLGNGVSRLNLETPNYDVVWDAFYQDTSIGLSFSQEEGNKRSSWIEFYGVGDSGEILQNVKSFDWNLVFIEPFDVSKVTAHWSYPETPIQELQGVSSVPEPGALGMFGLGLCLLGFMTRKSRKDTEGQLCCTG